MKGFSDSVKTFFVICGAVIGAGFLSGGELVAFSPSREIFYIAVAATVFFLGFALPYSESGAFARAAFLIADAVFAAAMLAGLDGIACVALNIKVFPVASAASLAAFYFLSDNVKTVERLNCVLTPLSVAIVVVALCLTATAPVPAPYKSGVKGFSNAVLYASTNVFVAMPAVNMGGKGKSVKARAISALAFACFFAAFAFFILRIAPQTDMPVLDLCKNTPAFPFLIAAFFIGSFTSFVCFAYPLKDYLDKTVKNGRRTPYFAVLCAFLFLLSRLGAGVIIKYLYPVIGGAGACVIVKNALGIKSARKGDTVLKRGKICLKERKPKSENLPKKNTATI